MPQTAHSSTTTGPFFEAHPLPVLGEDSSTLLTTIITPLSTLATPLLITPGTAHHHGLTTNTSPTGVPIPAGAAYLLLELGIVTPMTKIAGASSGALLTMGLCSGVEADKFMQITQQLSNTCRAHANCQGGLGSTVANSLGSFLPPEAWRRCRNRAYMSITFGEFPSKSASNKVSTGMLCTSTIISTVPTGALCRITWDVAWTAAGHCCALAGLACCVEFITSEACPRRHTSCLCSASTEVAGCATRPAQSYISCRMMATNGSVEKRNTYAAREPTDATGSKQHSHLHNS
jgi:hypothetical protein